MSSNYSNTTPTTLNSQQVEDIGSTFYITLFTLGSLLLILLILIACCSVLRTNRITNAHRPGSEPWPTKRGLDDDDGVLRGCPRMMFSQVKLRRGDDSSGGDIGSGCSICLADYKEVDVVVLLPNCGHFFHVACVERWLRLRSTCPICRDSPALGSADAEEA